MSASIDTLESGASVLRKKTSTTKGTIGERWTQAEVEYEGKWYGHLMVVKGYREWHGGYVDPESIESPRVITVERIEELREQYGDGFVSEMQVGPHFSVYLYSPPLIGRFMLLHGRHIKVRGQPLAVPSEYRYTVPTPPPAPPPRPKSRMAPPPPPPKKAGPPPPPRTKAQMATEAVSGKYNLLAPEAEIIEGLAKKLRPPPPPPKR